jgi:hypothetical protein
MRVLGVHEELSCKVAMFELQTKANYIGDGWVLSDFCLFYDLRRCLIVQSCGN